MASGILFGGTQAPTNTFVSPEDGTTYRWNGSAWVNSAGVNLTPEQGNALMSQAFQAGQAAGGGGLTPSQLVNLTQNQMTQADAGRAADEQSIADMEKEYQGIPDSLNSLYTNAAKRAGTYSGTGEFSAGLKSEVAQGTRGAQAALGSRLHALYSRLGKPVPQHLEQYGAGSAEQTVNNNVDGTVTETGGVGDAATTSSESSVETSAPADDQNAVAKVAEPTDAELTEEQKKKLLALQSATTT
jgi:hypothetical protein